MFKKLLFFLFLLVDYVEPATMAPFHIEGDDLQMMNNDERLAVSLVL